jgi:hypothetical protein
MKKYFQTLFAGDSESWLRTSGGPLGRGKWDEREAGLKKVSPCPSISRYMALSHIQIEVVYFS